ncbi:MAG: hypothetical protein N3C60_07625 [Calditerrivibrio sp.]|nr:hypothetical protein [Calditerrivibrio sp.]
MIRRLLSVLIIFLLYTISYAAVSTGTGTSSMDGGIKAADKRALNNALINAIANYYSEKNPDLAESITAEHIKLIKNYRIIERGVKQYTVYYTVEAEFDEIGSVSISTKSNPNTLVYFIKLENNLMEYKDIFYDSARFIIEEHGFSLKFQEDFLLNLDKIGDHEKAYSVFSKNRSRYMIFTTLKIEKLKNNTKLVSESYFYTKKDTYPIIRAEATIGKMNNDGLKESFVKVFLTTITYVNTNFLPMSKMTQNETKDQKIDLVFINFSSFNQVINIMDYLKAKGFFTTVKVKSFITGKAEFEINTRTDVGAITKVVKELLNNTNVEIVSHENAVIMEFR